MNPSVTTADPSIAADNAEMLSIMKAIPAQHTTRKFSQLMKIPCTVKISTLHKSFVTSSEKYINQLRIKERSIEKV